MKTLMSFFKARMLEILIIVFVIQSVQGAIVFYLGNKPIYIVLFALVILLLIGLTLSIHEMIKSRRISKGKFAPEGQTRKGVIFTLGLGSHRDDSVVLNVIKEYNPQFCGFLGTKETDSQNVTSQIVEKMHFVSDQYSAKTVDPTNVLEIKDDISHIFNWMLKNGLKPEEITLDLTSGTSIMSVGAYMVAEELNLEVQYVFSKYENNKVIPGSQKPFIIRSHLN